MLRARTCVEGIKHGDRLNVDVLGSKSLAPTVVESASPGCGFAGEDMQRLPFSKGLVPKARARGTSSIIKDYP